MERLAEILDTKYPQFNTITPQHLLTNALHQMCYENVEYLIVLEDEHFVGIIAEHDITQKIMFAGKSLAELTVADIMNRNLPVANVNDSIEYGMQQIDRHNTRYMAVYDGFEFEGVVSENDLLKGAICNQAPLELAEAQAYPWHY